MASDLFQADDPQAPCTDPGRLLSRSGRAPGVVVVLFFLLQLEYRLYLAPSAVRTQHLADRHRYNIISSTSLQHATVLTMAALNRVAEKSGCVFKWREEACGT